MASNLSVFEVMIHHIDADKTGALLLQQRLRQDGIRAGLTELSAAKGGNRDKISRHSLCLIGPAFSERDNASVLCDPFDFVYVKSSVKADILSGNVFSSYGKLVNHIIHGREGVLINATELRRKTWLSYEAIASQFTDVWFDTMPDEAIEMFLKHLPRAANILDAGCGPGHHSRFFKMAGFNPVGIDFSWSMLAIAKAKNKHISFEHGDVLLNPMPRAYFDGVWSAVMLNHIPAEDLPIALKNLVTSLRWGGIIGLNFQVGRPSEIVSRDRDHRFFEYPADENGIRYLLEALGICIVDTHFGTTTRNLYGLPLEMRFVTVVGRKKSVE